MIRGRRSLLLPSIVILVAVGTIISGVLTPRDVSLGEAAMVVGSSSDLVAFDVARSFTGALLLLSAAGIVVAIYNRGFPRAGFSLWLSYQVFVVLNFVLPGIAGEVPRLDFRYLNAALVITAVYVARPMAGDHLVVIAKAALGAFIYGSLATAVLMPEHVLAADYGSFIPGLQFRLYGVAGGATTLGAQAAAYLAIESVSPTPSRMRWLHVGAAVCALVMAQSKTAWFFVFIGLLVRMYRLVERGLFGGGTVPRKHAWMARNALLLVVGTGCVSIAALLVGRIDLSALQGGENIRTLTGRTSIWESSIRVWLDNPVFGYGLGLWVDDAFRAKHGAFAHAHSQFIHALASAGLLGLLGLLVYLRAAFVAALAAVKESTIPIVVLVLVLTQSVTDVPLRNYYVLDAFFLLHLLLFAFLIQAAHMKTVDERPPRRGTHGMGAVNVGGARWAR